MRIAGCDAGASYPALYYPSCAEKIGQFSLTCSPHAVSGLRFSTCCVDLCSGLPFSQSDKTGQYHGPVFPVIRICKVGFTMEHELHYIGIDTAKEKLDVDVLRPDGR
ncbi:hypothetical protein, partial [Escherichia sp. E3659]|uniref:hypothetical protein n=1 Tax=Escherichia sp. E3659 TaxID=2044462 RepID=UPI00197AC29A